MEILTGKRVTLSKWTKDDIHFLFDCRNNPDYRNFCSMRKEVISFENFKKEFLHDLSKDRGDQFIIKNKHTSNYIGTIFLYDLNLWHKNCFVTTFIMDNKRKAGYGVEAFYLFCDFLFKKYHLEKIVIDIYSNNLDALKIINKTIFEKEGHFKKHRRDMSGTWLDIFRFSLFKEKFRMLL